MADGPVQIEVSLDTKKGEQSLRQFEGKFQQTGQRMKSLLDGVVQGFGTGLSLSLSGVLGQVGRGIAIAAGAGTTEAVIRARAAQAVGQQLQQNAAAFTSEEQIQKAFDQRLEFELRRQRAIAEIEKETTQRIPQEVLQGVAEDTQGFFDRLVSSVKDGIVEGFRSVTNSLRPDR